MATKTFTYDVANSLHGALMHAFKSKINADVKIVARDGQKIRAHKCVLATSPILSSILKCDDSDALFFVDFSMDLIRLLLQLLYTGQVELQKSQDVILDFIALCQLLSIDPNVSKVYHDDGNAASSQCSGYLSSQSASAGSKTGKVDLKNVSPASASEPALQAPVDAPASEQSESQPQTSYFGLDGTGMFKMPDNFDLPDEFFVSASSSSIARDDSHGAWKKQPQQQPPNPVAEFSKQMPGGRKPGANLHGSNSGQKMKKLVSSETRFDAALSMKHQLEEKRRRMLQKIREDLPLDVGRRKKVPQRTSRQYSSSSCSNSGSSSSSSSFSDSDDELPSPRSLPKRRGKGSDSGAHEGQSKVLSVSIQLRSELFVNLSDYRLSLPSSKSLYVAAAGDGSSSSSSSKKKRALKRIKQFWSSSDDDDQGSDSRDASASYQSGRIGDFEAGPNQSASQSDKTISPPPPKQPILSKPSLKRSDSLASASSPPPSIQFSYGLSSENKLLAQKDPDEVSKIFKMNFKKKSQPPQPDVSFP